MLDFELHIPTKILFGKHALSQVGEETAKLGHKVLIHHDGGSYLAGILELVKASLAAKGVDYIELGGVKPNPRISLMEQGVRLCREQNVDCVLAIGGGSVMDSSKVIAFCAVNDGDITSYAAYKKFSPNCLPLGAIVTTPGTGSEVSNNAMAVDDRGEKLIKYAIFQDSFRFKFAIMDPRLTYSLPKAQTASGAMDILSHTMERYFNGANQAEPQNRLAEANMKSAIQAVMRALENPQDYEARANLMFTSTLAQCGLLNIGLDSDWAVHGIENVVTTTFSLTHGICLGVLTPAWMKYVFKRDIPKFAQFAVRVMGADADFYDAEKTALRGIELFQSFVKSLGLPTALHELGVMPESFEMLAALATREGPVGAVSKLNKEDIINIYKLAQ